ncbi:M17 family peptidase N-terminal domain-containing protein [Sphingomonas abietis]|uniref:Peptidase M17 leucyl aminopeptidase N-terminal domain-containing protein n=1 Tax=Sphingomonas abietis TaxID=3012344 RepID=A0ABY7NMT6_9SPHN|nr:M17 family peptidase N-terminal domain-containing protein [Sphingomonas abietis]WBO21796.1 hypothetical protein PBT88_16735 [Sphingomonas abietis]
MSDDRQTAAGSIFPIGRCGDVDIDIVVGDLSTTEADLAIVGICSRKPIGSELVAAVDGLNRAMQGAIVRLRSDGIFTSRWGETLFLTSPPPPIVPKSVMLLGLGPTGRSVASHTRRAVRAAANQASRLGGAHVVFAPARLETGSARFDAAASTRAILRGVTDVVAVQPGKLERWTFLASSVEAAGLAEQFRIAFATVWEH